MKIGLGPSYDLVFVTTSSNVSLLEQYLKSVYLNKQVNLLVVLVCQDNIHIDSCWRDATTLKTICCEGKLSLSRARNIALNWLEQEKIQFSYVMFPDDDSTFDEAFFRSFNEVILDSCNHIIDVKYPSGGFFMRHKFKDGQVLNKSNWNKACSVNMVICYASLKRLKEFDENLGVGAKYGSGEDCDFFIRCQNEGFKFVFTNRLATFHPQPKKTYDNLPLNLLVKRFDNYGKGIIFLLIKHSMPVAALNACLRGFGGCFISLVRGDFRLSYAYFFSTINRFSLFIHLKSKGVKYEI